MSLQQRRRSLAVLWVGQFAATAGLTVVVPLLPFYIAGLGVAQGDVAWWTGVCLAAPAATQLIFAPLWGLLGDRYSRKAMVVRAHAGLGLAVGLMAIARTPEAFLLCRLLQGACGGVVAATATYATVLAEPERRGRALGAVFGATAAGALIGPLAGGVLVSEAGFTPLFLGVASLLALSSLAALLLLTETARPVEEGMQRRLRAVASGLLRASHCRNLLFAGIAGQAAVFALVVVFATRVAQITGSLREAIVWVGVLQALTWAASSVAAPWWGRRNDARPPHRGFALAAAGCALAVGLQGLPASPPTLVPLRIVQGLCFAAMAQAVLHVVSHALAERLRGAGLGAATAVLDLGQVVGPLLGVGAAMLLPAPATFAAIGALLALAASLALRSDHQYRVQPVGIAPHRQLDLTHG